jgi:hypothetical protein
MQLLKGVIAAHQRELKNHLFFELLAASDSIAPIAAMARSCAWWPMVFQDLLRLNLRPLRGTWFERFADHHRREDAGHERWYLDDLRSLGVEPPGLDELFGKAFEPIREACYELMSEVLREQSSPRRVALLLAIEAAGHVFFEEISAAVDRICPDLPLRYFARSHLLVEKDHDLFTEATNKQLNRLVLSDDDRAEAEESVARICRTFDQVFSYYAVPFEECLRKTSDIRALGEVPPSVRHARGS